MKKSNVKNLPNNKGPSRTAFSCIFNTMSWSTVHTRNSAKMADPFSSIPCCMGSQAVSNYMKGSVVGASHTAQHVYKLCDLGSYHAGICCSLFIWYGCPVLPVSHYYIHVILVNVIAFMFFECRFFKVMSTSTHARTYASRSLFYYYYYLFWKTIYNVSKISFTIESQDRTRTH